MGSRSPLEPGEGGGEETTAPKGASRQTLLTESYLFLHC